MLISAISMCSAIRLHLGTQGTLSSSCILGDDPLPDIDEEPPRKRQRQLGKNYNRHIMYENVVILFFYVLHDRLNL